MKPADNAGLQAKRGISPLSNEIARRNAALRNRRRPQILLSNSRLMLTVRFKESGKICSENEVETDAEHTARSPVDGSLPLPGQALANPIP